MTAPKKKPPRRTLSDELAAQHELLMAAVTKTPPRGSESVTLKQAQVGDLKGRWLCDELRAIRGDEEDWPQYLGRITSMLADVDKLLMAHNAAEIQRQMQATVDKNDRADEATRQRQAGRIAASKGKR